MSQIRRLAVACALAAACGTLAQGQERRVVATGAVAEIDETRNTVRLTGDATLQTAEGTIASREIEARLTRQGEIESAEARGAVKLDFRYRTREGVERVMRGSADRAVYDAAQRTVVLTGSIAAELSEPARGSSLAVSGQELTFWIDEGRLRLRPARLVFTEVEKQQPPPQE